MKKKLRILLIPIASTLLLLGCNFLGLPQLVLQTEPEPTVTVNRDRPVRTVSVPTPTAIPSTLQAKADAQDRLLVDLYAQISPSVVNVQVLNPSSPDRDGASTTGSGFVYDSTGHIVTNNHLLDSTSEVLVTFKDGAVARGQIVGRDPDTDLAVIQVENTPQKLSPVAIADSDALAVGQQVTAFGNPFGLSVTMSDGFVGAKGRTLPLGRSSNSVGGRFSIPELIQTDAVIEPGNSGGPLVDSRGHLVGVNRALDDSIYANLDFASGVGFAIPSNIVRRVVPALIENGEIAYPWLGITGTTVNLALAEEMGLSHSRGALVIEVYPQSPASRAGLQGSQDVVVRNGTQFRIGGDVIVGIGRTPVKNMDDLILYLMSEARVGQQIQLTVLRDGQKQTIEVELMPRPEG